MSEKKKQGVEITTQDQHAPAPPALDLGGK